MSPLGIGSWALCTVAFGGAIAAGTAMGAGPPRAGVVRGAAQPAPAPPVTVANRAAFPIAVTAGDYDLYAFVVDFPAGSGTPRHIHGGPVVVTVIAGQLVLQRAGGERVLKTGDSVIENPGDVHALVNRSDVPARIAASELIPKGAAETTLK